jgi:hypothetical protein
VIDSSQFDVRELEDLVLPFDVQTKELNPKPRLVEGENMWITPGGRLARRPGMQHYTQIPAIDAGLPGAEFRVERLCFTHSIGGAAYHVLMSAKHFTALPPNYKLMHWTLPLGPYGSTQADYHSLSPHEMLQVNGKVYSRLRANGVSSEHYNALQKFTNPLNLLLEAQWGLPIDPVNAPTFAATTASAGTYTTRVGWKYAYAYETVTGHVGNRSDHVDIGPQTNKSIGIGITPTIDGTIAPWIRIYRTTDGGGLFAQIARVANPGVAFQFWDGSSTPGAGTPIMDYNLDLSLSNLAPDRVINSGPPARNYPSVYPDATATHSNLAYFAGRIWYAVQNKLYFSGKEEIYSGTPEECFPDPNGIRGNWYLLPDDVISLCATQDRLFVFTTADIFVVRGEDRVNLRLTNFARNSGMLPNMKLATTSYLDTVFYMTSDWQVHAITGDNTAIHISRDIAPLLRTMGISTTDVQMVTWNAEGVSWLVVAMINHNTQANTRVFVYDLERRIWFTPWVVPVTAMATGQIASDDPYNRLWFAVTGADGRSYLCFVNLNTPTDEIDAVSTFSCYAVTSLMDIPAGNHVNLLRQPGHHPMLSFLKLEHTATGAVPTVEYRLDEFAGAWTAGTAENPPFIAQRSSYKTWWYPIQQVVQRVQMKISFPPSNTFDDIQTLGAVFTPESGA